MQSCFCLSLQGQGTKQDVLENLAVASKEERRACTQLLALLLTCRALRQRQARFPVLLLSTGGLSWHADSRRTSIAAAIAWALEAGLQGLVLDSGAAQEQQAAVAHARSKGLKVGCGIPQSCRGNGVCSALHG
jgi:hypothetical protein